MLLTLCRFYIRREVDGGYMYDSFNADTPQSPFMPLATAPQTTDLVWLYDSTTKTGSTYRVLERSWLFPEYGSRNWPHGTPEPTAGPMVQIIVEAADGPFRNEAQATPEAPEPAPSEE